MPEQSPLKPAAEKLLRALADQPARALIYSGRSRTTWRIGSESGPSAHAETFRAIESAGYAEIAYEFAGGRRITITDAGRTRIATP